MRRRAPFEDRRDAGSKLAERLARWRGYNVIVLGLPRGGVPVAYEIARALQAPLDVIVARKVGAPMQPELGIGAVAPGGVLILDRWTIRALSLSDRAVQRAVAQEREEMERRLQRYRGGRSMPELQDRTVILVDDGLATGVTATAAIEAIRRQKPERIILATPVCARETAAAMVDEVDDLICLHAPEQFRAVGLWYEDFGQTTDAEVIELLEEAQGNVTSDAFREL